MSHVTHPRITSHVHLSRRSAWVAALLALAATAAVVLALAIGGDSAGDTTSAATPAQPSLRAGGGPEESGVAASVGAREAAGPSESATAAAIGRGSSSHGATGVLPDESRTAASISGR